MNFDWLKNEVRAFLDSMDSPGNIDQFKKLLEMQIECDSRQSVLDALLDQLSIKQHECERIDSMLKEQALEVQSKLDEMTRAVDVGQAIEEKLLRISASASIKSGLNTIMSEQVGENGSRREAAAVEMAMEHDSLRRKIAEYKEKYSKNEDMAANLDNELDDADVEENEGELKILRSRVEQLDKIVASYEAKHRLIDEELREERKKSTEKIKQLQVDVNELNNLKKILVGDLAKNDITRENISMILQQLNKINTETSQKIDDFKKSAQPAIKREESLVKKIEGLSLTSTKIVENLQETHKEQETKLAEAEEKLKAATHKNQELNEKQRQNEIRLVIQDVITDVIKLARKRGKDNKLQSDDAWVSKSKKVRFAPGHTMWKFGKSGE